MKIMTVLRLSGKILFRYIAASLICLMLDLSVMLFLNNPLGRALCQLLCLSASFSLIYTCVWNVGFADRNMVKYEHSKQDSAKGFKAGSVALIIPMIISVILVLGKLLGKWGAFLYTYRFLNPIFMPLNYSLLPATLSLDEIGILPVIVSALVPLIFIIMSGCGYLLGYRDVTVKSALGIKGRAPKAE